MKQAKQQSQDLRQTDDFLTAIMKPGHPEKEKATKPPSLESSAHRQMNGRPKVPRVDSFSRFSDPPAPPPQQPLPEKPDAPSRTGSDAFSPLKRSDTDKPKPVSANSPVSRDSSQILSLIEALSSAKREIDTQGVRVKELEDLLSQERAARESAEEKVKLLETQPKLETSNVKLERDVVDKSLETEPAIKLENGVLEEPAQQTNGSILPSEASGASEASQTETPADVNTTQLQIRLDTMMEEMEEMRKQVASFRERAEKAEDESAHSRQSLAEMIETIRKERAEKDSVAAPDNKSDAQGVDSTRAVSGQSTSTENGTAEPKPADSSVPRSDPALSKGKESDAASTALAAQWDRRKFLDEASPYASMFGVVLLGVGLMAYLNGWQKLDK